MTFVNTSLDDLLALPVEEKWRLCLGEGDDGATAECALLLGGRPDGAIARAKTAAAAYRDGRVKTIVPSGGVEWDWEGGRITESHLMAGVLREGGVPEDAILIENEATTTKENMWFGMVQMIRHYRKVPRSVLIVTSAAHMNRSLILARAYLPARTALFPCRSYPPDVEAWLRSDAGIRFLDNELRLVKKLEQSGEAASL